MCLLIEMEETERGRTMSRAHKMPGTKISSAKGSESTAGLTYGIYTYIAAPEPEGFALLYHSMRRKLRGAASAQLILEAEACRDS